MPAGRRNGSHTVRPRSNGRVPRALCLAVFVVVAAAVYYWGQVVAERSQPRRTYTSTAVIFQKGVFPGDEIAEEEGAFAQQDPGEIQRRITSEAYVARALRGSSAAAEPSSPGISGQKSHPPVERVRANLEVKAAPTSLPGELTIWLSCTDEDPEQAARLANALAELHVADFCTWWKARAERKHDEALQKLEQAKRELVAAEARRDAFSELHFRQLDSAAEKSAALEVAPSPPEPQPAATPGASTSAMIDNPRWRELSEQLAELKRRRDDLLRTRTWEHPEVQYVDVLIAAAEKDLEEVERKIPGDPGESSEPIAAPPAEVAPAPGWRPDPDALEKFEQLAAAATAARRARDGAAAAERRAWQVLEKEPPIQSTAAQPGKVLPESDPRLALILLALSAGVASAAGVGLIARGASMEPAVERLGQVERALPVPVIGTIPPGDSSHGLATIGRRPFSRVTTISSGLILIVGCAGMLIVALGGW